ncbi:hypothetical protein [Pseudomonas viridiflava]|uniref:hypothetical protein n=1 Tax=Pseudomonas viridiflava TaxID=33069 RepID=UPI0013C3361D|nr:hypothetical protein [Pseudomonas viridiflava]
MEEKNHRDPDNRNHSDPDNINHRDPDYGSDRDPDSRNRRDPDESIRRDPDEQHMEDRHLEQKAQLDAIEQRAKDAYDRIKAEAARTSKEKANLEDELRSLFSEKKTERISRIKYRSMYAVSMLTGFIASIYSVGLWFYPEFGSFVFKSWEITLSVLVALICIMVGVIVQAYMPKREKGFVGIDIRAQEEKNERYINEKINAAIKLLEVPPRSPETVTKSEDSIKISDEYFASVTPPSGTAVSKFESYVAFLVRELDFQILTFDTKASELLDTGIKFLLWGISAYVVSIFIWQFAIKNGYVGEYAIIGMVSCTLAFLVVEFLAAWFLRQYKGFVESSIHLVKARSLFNRYMLSYHAVVEFSNPSEEIAAIRGQILKVLEETVKWPEASVAKAGDLNHMVAMFESVSKVIEVAKSDSDKASTDKKKASASEAPG